ncbi:DDE-type integrase/transposase/recombinase [Herbaspirillum sp. RU 5E]|nr:DDE-type integrase/transposase/recombinase [Herbaspirillum sp. RU 5E]
MHFPRYLDYLKKTYSISLAEPSFPSIFPSRSPVPQSSIFRRTSRMTTYNLSIGLTLRRGMQLLEFRKMINDDEVQFEDAHTGRIYTWTLANFFRDVTAKRLEIVHGNSANQSSKSNDGPQFISNLDSLPEAVLADLDRKFSYINAAKKQGITRGQRKLLEESISKTAEIRKEKAPSTSWVMNYWRELENRNMNPAAIITKNYRRRRSTGIPSHMTDLIRKILRTEYFTTKRHPLSRSVTLINNNLRSLGETPLRVSESTVRRIANEVDGYYRDAARYGVSYARNKWRYSLGGVKSKRVLERVEVDHTQLDMVVVCDRSGLPMGRPTITIVVDSFSGYVIGFYVSFWGTGLAPTLNALRVAISPKQIYTEGISGLTHKWMGFGIFELAVVDNGLEFHSPQFKLAAWHLNTDIQYCAVRQPWLKPKVERALGIVSQNLPAQGRVHKTENNYLPPDPRKTAAITFSQLCNGLLKLFVDVMPFEVNDYTLRQPYQEFKDGFEKLPPPEFNSSYQELELISALSKNLTVGNAGVESSYLHYNSPELQQMRRQIGLTFKTTVKYQPEDLGHVYIQDPISKNWIVVPSCDPGYTQGLSIIQHRAIRLLKKSQLNRNNAIATLEQGKIEMIDMYNDFLRGNQGKKNIAAAQKFGSLTSSQTLLSEPTNGSHGLRSHEQLVDANAYAIPEKDIPSFSSFSLD